MLLLLSVAFALGIRRFLLLYAVGFLVIAWCSRPPVVHSETRIGYVLGVTG